MPGINMAAFWLAAVIVLLVVEGAVPGLVSIWFAIGALAAFIAALVHAQLWLQIVWFLVISLATLGLTRPLAKKYVNGKVQPTNADRLIGKDCVVTEKIDNLQGTGQVNAGGMSWTARSAEEGLCFEKGSVVTVCRIEGVKLIVSACEKV